MTLDDGLATFIENIGKEEKMTEVKYLAALSGFEAEEFEDFEEVVRLMNKVKEFEVENSKREAVGSGNLRQDKPKESYNKAEILKNSKSGFKIPRIM